MNNLEAVQRVLSLQAERGENQQQILKFLGIHGSSFHRWKKNPNGKLSSKIVKKLLPESSQANLSDVRDKIQVIPLPVQHKASDSGSLLPIGTVPAGTVDKKRRSYNPEMHLSDESGNPILDDDLDLIIKPKQRDVDFQDKRREEREKENEEKRITEETEQKAIHEEQQSINTEKELSLKAKSVATLSGFVFFKGGSAFFGKRFEPNKEEKAEIEQALERYWKLKGAPDVPPVVELATVLGMYTAKKVASSPPEPNTLFAKFKNFFKNRKRKKFQSGLNKVQDEIKNEFKEEGDDNDNSTKEPDNVSLSGGFPTGALS